MPMSMRQAENISDDLLGAMLGALVHIGQTGEESSEYRYIRHNSGVWHEIEITVRVVAEPDLTKGSVL